MKRLLCIFILTVLILSSAACGNNVKVDQSERTAIEAVVEKGIQALNDEDAKTYLETCYITADEENEKTYDDVYEEKRQEVLEVFTWFDLEYTIDDIDVVSVDETTAVAVVTESVRDSAEDTIFEDTTEKIRMIFIKVDGEWLVQDSEEAD